MMSLLKFSLWCSVSVVAAIITTALWDLFQLEDTRFYWGVLFNCIFAAAVAEAYDAYQEYRHGREIT